MYVAKCEISIGSGKSAFRFNRATAVEIRKSTQLLMDSAMIRLPTTALMKDVKASTTVEVANEVKVGMPVNICLWYQGGENQAITFSGYVKRINRKTPVEIECEDAIGLLRQKNLCKDWKDVTLETVLQEIVSGTGIALTAGIPAIHLRTFYLKNVNGMEALQRIRDEFGLSVYMNNSDELYCGLVYKENYGLATYCLTGGSANIVQADRLQWQDKSDVRVCVKAIGVKTDNTCIAVTVGDQGGALNVLRFYNIENEGELRALAEQELSKLQFEGYRGRITAFLLPGVFPGMVAEMNDEKYPQRQGRYFIESVRTLFGTEGCRNEVELGIKVL